MEKLLDLARQKGVKAEIIKVEKDRLPVSFKNGELDILLSERSVDYALRVIKDGKLGFVSTSSLDDRRGLLDKVLAMCIHGFEAGFDFPAVEEIVKLETVNESLKDVSAGQMIEEGRRLIDYLKSRIPDKVSVFAGLSRVMTSVRIANTSGIDYRQDFTVFSGEVGGAFPGSGSGPWTEQLALGFKPVSDKKLNDVVRQFKWGKEDSTPDGGKMQVLFAPSAYYALDWRLAAGISGRNLMDGISPLKGKVGEKVLDERVTIWDKAHYPNHPIARSFDDEGVATSDRKIFDKGVFTGFLHSLYTASKVEGAQPTGHGYKQGQWQSGIATPPSPQTCHLAFEPGEKSSEKMIADMKEGVILYVPLGAHSGNIPVGQLSVSVGVGYHVKDGKVQGRAIDTMFSGNVYEMFKRLGGVSKNLSDGGIPWLLFDDVDVTGK